MESSLKALLHTCHRLLQAGCQAWLLPHMASVWNTLFDSFQAFCQTCQQLTTASCAAAAHPQQQQAQAQQKLHSEHSSQGSVQLQSVAARVAMFNAMDSGKGNKSRCNAPPLAVQQGTEQQARLEQEGVPQTHMQQPQRLLTLLTRCAQMEHLLAYLLPGFLTLSPVEAQQVRQACMCCMILLLDAKHGHCMLLVMLGSDAQATSL